MGNRILCYLAPLACAFAVANDALAAAEIDDIRIGQHRTYLRVVLDLSGQAKYSIADNGEVIVEGVETGSAVLNADSSQAPLRRITVIPEEGRARISFDSTRPVNIKAFSLTPDSFGGHRLVVDLLPKSNRPPAKARAQGAKDAAKSAPMAEDQSAHKTPEPNRQRSRAVPAVAASSSHSPMHKTAHHADGSEHGHTGSNQDTMKAPHSEPSGHTASHHSSKDDDADAHPMTGSALTGSALTGSALSGGPKVSDGQSHDADHSTEHGDHKTDESHELDHHGTAMDKPDQSHGDEDHHDHGHEEQDHHSALDAGEAQAAKHESVPAGLLTMSAEMALAEGRLAEACRLAGQALNSKASDLRALAVRGSCLVRQGDAEGAKIAFNDALELDPSFHRARIGLAEAEAALGNHTAAQAQLETVLAASPPTPAATVLVEKLENLKPAAVQVPQT